VSALVPFVALSSSAVLVLSFIPLALLVVGSCVVVVLRRTWGDDQPIAKRYLLLAVAVGAVLLGSTLAGSPVGGDASGQCGSSAADAADAPADATPDTNGASCRTLGQREVHESVTLLGLGSLLALGVLLRTKRPDDES
jgi:hypothetical protein